MYVNIVNNSAPIMQHRYGLSRHQSSHIIYVIIISRSLLHFADLSGYLLRTVCILKFAKHGI